MKTDFEIIVPEHGQVQVVQRTTMTTYELLHYCRQLLATEQGTMRDQLSEVLPPAALRGAHE